MFAQSDAATFWVVIIGAIFLGLAKIVDMILAYMREQKKIERDKVITEKVEEIHIATNSMKDQLVLKTEAEALARGGVEERARADAALQESSRPGVQQVDITAENVEVNLDPAVKEAKKEIKKKG